MQEVIYCRWSPTLGALEDTAEKVWGTPPYPTHLGFPVKGNPAVFFGVYGLPDFYAVWRHRGPKFILWAGTDILHFKKGYWLDTVGEIRLDPRPLAAWLNEHCYNWCENEVEQKALAEAGINAQVCPSFLGDIDAFPLSYEPSDRPEVYVSVSGDNFGQYGWHRIPELAKKNPDIRFHLYGNKTPAIRFFGTEYMHPNMIEHGRVPKEQMNEEIKRMQGGLRLTEFDGFSEILAKSVLWGQWPISLIPYPHMLGVDEIGTLKEKREANIEGREYYRARLNNFPWNLKS